VPLASCGGSCGTDAVDSPYRWAPPLIPDSDVWLLVQTCIVQLQHGILTCGSWCKLVSWDSDVWLLVPTCLVLLGF
jgi:hypothetical protein